MKKLFLSLSVLASLLMAGCTSDDAGTVDETDGKVSTHYMCVNIVSADGGSATRANPEYEDGSDTENEVEKIRFYFFTENGAAANVKLSPSGTNYQNYYDCEKDSIVKYPSLDPTNNIESFISATIILNTKEGDQLPRTIVAVLNPDADLLAGTSQGLGMLRGVSNDYAKNDLTQKGKFVMTNSTYADGPSTKKEVCPVYIENKHICETMEAAKNEPVTIYVERNVAKVKVSLGSSVTADKIELKNKDNENITYKTGDQDKQVCLKLDGWALTAETDKGYLSKRLNPQWSTTWWYEGYADHRCTWAVNASDAKNRWIPTYNSINKQFGTDSLYTNENAAPFSEGTATNTLEYTKFIVKGQLCDENGNALTLVRHLGQLFADTYSSTESSNLPGLKASILGYLQSDGYDYWKGSGSGRTEITAADIEIVPNTVTGVKIEKEQSNNNCYVHAKLTTTAEGETWYASSSADDETTVPVADINAVLKDKTKIGEALVWREGQTYYYAEIIHRNVDPQTPGTPGVVRNHVYKARINGITGLGTPVYDPGEVIYPEKPEQDDHYIAATIDILSWRVISYDYTLDW